MHAERRSKNQKFRGRFKDDTEEEKTTQTKSAWEEDDTELIQS